MDLVVWHLFRHSLESCSAIHRPAGNTMINKENSVIFKQPMLNRIIRTSIIFYLEKMVNLVQNVLL